MGIFLHVLEFKIPQQYPVLQILRPNSTILATLIRGSYFSDPPLLSSSFLIGWEAGDFHVLPPHIMIGQEAIPEVTCDFSTGYP